MTNPESTQLISLGVAPEGNGSYLVTVVEINWSEPTATNALVENEVVQAVLGMNQKHILPYPRFLVFPRFLVCSRFSTPKFFPSTYLPPTYLPPPTSFLPTSPHFALTPSSKLKKA